MKSQSVRVKPKPVPAFAANNREGCNGSCISFTNSSIIATGSIKTCQWQFGDGSLPNYVYNPTHCYQTGTYAVTLKLVSDSGCMASLVQPSYIIIHPTPLSSFAFFLLYEPSVTHISVLFLIPSAIHVTSSLVV